MKTKLMLAAVFSVLAAAAAVAQEQGRGAVELPAPVLKAEKAQRGESLASQMDQIDAIQRPAIDLEAQYWAWDIQNLDRTSYADLGEKSKRWIIKAETRDLLFKKIKQKLDAGKVPALTPAERARYNESKEAVRRILSPGRYDQQARDSVTIDYCVDLKARYWAHRVQHGETEILTYARTTWPYPKEMRDRMVAAIEAKVKDPIIPLTRDELYKMDACTGKMHGN